MELNNAPHQPGNDTGAQVAATEAYAPAHGVDFGTIKAPGEAPVGLCDSDVQQAEAMLPPSSTEMQHHNNGILNGMHPAVGSEAPEKVSVIRHGDS